MAERILVVDDCEDFRSLMGLMLNRAGYEVLQAASGEEALRTLEVHSPSVDLVLLDVDMPHVNGYEFCKTLKQDPTCSDLPVIFISTHGDLKHKLQGLEIGGADYIPKTYDHRELLARVRTQLSLHQRSRMLAETNDDLSSKQKKVDRELRDAAAIQHLLLPKAAPAVDCLKVDWKFLPCAKVGGDIFNVFMLDQHHVGLYMLDVCGHGMPAALVTSAVSHVLQPHTGYLVTADLDAGNIGHLVSPENVLRRLDAEFPFERFDRHFTIVYMVFDLVNGTVISANGGHPRPIRISADGEVEFFSEMGGLIGLGEETFYQEEQKSLQSGDKVLLYTDGLTECENEDSAAYGENRLLDLVKDCAETSCYKLLDEILESLAEYSSGSPIRDDISLLAFEYI